jgi:hypothetical protein
MSKDLIDEAMKFDRFEDIPAALLSQIEDIPAALLSQIRRAGYFWLRTRVKMDGEVKEAFNFIAKKPSARRYRMEN